MAYFASLSTVWGDEEEIMEAKYSHKKKRDNTNNRLLFCDWFDRLWQ